MIPNDLVELPHVRPSIVLRAYPILRDVKWLDPQVQQPMAPLAPSHEEIAHIHAPMIHRDDKVDVLVLICCRAAVASLMATRAGHWVVKKDIACHALVR